MMALKSDITVPESEDGDFCRHDRDKASALRNISLREDHT